MTARSSLAVAQSPQTKALQLRTPMQLRTRVLRTRAPALMTAVAAQEAQLRARLMSGLQGAQLREAQRGLSAAHDAYVGVALGAATGASAEHAVRVARHQGCVGCVVDASKAGSTRFASSFTLNQRTS